MVLVTMLKKKLQLSQRREITKKKYTGPHRRTGPTRPDLPPTTSFSLSPLPVVRRGCASIQFVCEERHKSSGGGGRRTQTAADSDTGRGVLPHGHKAPPHRADARRSLQRQGEGPNQIRRANGRGGGGGGCGHGCAGARGGGRDADGRVAVPDPIQPLRAAVLAQALLRARGRRAALLQGPARLHARGKFERLVRSFPSLSAADSDEVFLWVGASQIGVFVTTGICSGVPTEIGMLITMGVI
jgi:hypothetical protein